MSKLQLTLSIIKPYILKNPHATKSIQDLIQKNGFRIVQRTRINLTKPLAGEFYKEHQGKFFYNRLQTFMCRYFDNISLNQNPNMIGNLMVFFFVLSVDQLKYLFFRVITLYRDGESCWDQQKYINPFTHIQTVFVVFLGFLTLEMFVTVQTQPSQLSER